MSAAEQGIDPATLSHGPTGGELPNVHQAMARAMSTVRAVGKWGRNTDQGYAFRSIDHFMTALNPAMADAGVHVVPRVLKRVTEERQTRSGGRLRCVDLKVRFTFYGPAGDHVSAVVWGEGADTADKATNKALTGAFKYAIMQAFMVPTEDLRDADRDTPDVAHQRPQQQPAPQPEQASGPRPVPPEEPPPGVDPATGEVTEPGVNPKVQRASELAAKAWRVRKVESLKSDVYEPAQADGVLRIEVEHPREPGKRLPLAALITVRKAELLGEAQQQTDGDQPADDTREDVPA